LILHAVDRACAIIDCINDCAYQFPLNRRSERNGSYIASNVVVAGDSIVFHCLFRLAIKLLGGIKRLVNVGIFPIVFTESLAVFFCFSGVTAIDLKKWICSKLVF